MPLLNGKGRFSIPSSSFYLLFLFFYSVASHHQSHKGVRFVLEKQVVRKDITSKYLRLLTVSMIRFGQSFNGRTKRRIILTLDMSNEIIYGRFSFSIVPFFIIVRACT